jgi:hypothetical protein
MLIKLGGVGGDEEQEEMKTEYRKSFLFGV